MLTEVKYNTEFELKKNTLYLTLTGKLWSVSCDIFLFFLEIDHIITALNKISSLAGAPCFFLL